MQTWVPLVPSNIKEIPQAHPLLPTFPQSHSTPSYAVFGCRRHTANWTHYIGSRVKNYICHELSEPQRYGEATGNTFGSGNGKQQTNVHIYLCEVVSKKGS